MSGSDPILPILQRRDEIERAILRHQVVVICGQTGSGKTTQLPRICLELLDAQGDRSPAHWGERGIIGHTQPRRLAARAVAARIAEERGESLGGTVGVKVRFNDQTSRRTRIKVMTDGILLAELSSDPRLLAYSTIIIDEAHERSLNIDFLLGYLTKLLPRRPDLKLLITSATIDTQRFSEHFGGPAVAPVHEISGRTYPVEIRYRPIDADHEKPANVQADHPIDAQVDIQAVADAVEDLITPGLHTGDVLVFLPGEREIRLVSDALARRQSGATVLPLYSRLSDQQQDLIFHPPKNGPQRVILSTNVAETSLTVPGIRNVIDAGLVRLSRYNPDRKIQHLPIEPASRASADQRAGRCGRVAPGVCVRMYSEASYLSRPAFTDPEIRRTSLASVILQLKSQGPGFGAVEDFPFLDRPSTRSIQDGYETLFELGAITAAGPESLVTPIGARMACIPADPRIARMLIGAEQEGAVGEVVILAAALSIRDPRERPMSRPDDADRAQGVFRDESSDFLSLLKLWDQYQHALDTMTPGLAVGWCRDHFLAPARMREWSELVKQFLDVAGQIGLARAAKPASADAIHRALLTGLISNVACREGDGSFEYRGVRGNVVQIFPGSALFKKGPRWIMAAEVVRTTRLYARTVAKIDSEWIEELAGHMFRHQLSDQHLDTSSGVPSAWERVTMSGIVVVPRRRTDLAPHDPSAARECFVREALAQARWECDLGFMRHNREILAEARHAEAALRQRDVLVSDEQLAAWFDARIPAHVLGPGLFVPWLREAEQIDPQVLRLSLDDVLVEQARGVVGSGSFPREAEIGDGDEREVCQLGYSLTPGRDEDGITLTVPLCSLSLLTPRRAGWSVPGFIPQIIIAHIKALPKTARAAVERQGELGEISAACAAVIRFDEGTIEHALSETLSVLYGVTIAETEWAVKSLPAHLRLRVRVIDHIGKEIAADRDVASLNERLRGRVERARAAERNALVSRISTSWDFGHLADFAHDAGTTNEPVLSLEDRGGGVSLVRSHPRRLAALHTARGVRRLFQLAVHDEIEHHIDSYPRLSDVVKHFGQLGTPQELRDHLALLIAERVFTDGQAPVIERAAFEDRLVKCRGRLSVGSRDVIEVVANILEPRFRIAQRLAGGTPRLWAESVADIREHAAYLMPNGFLSLVPCERLRHYPRYATVLQQRLIAMRADGSKANQDALRLIAPHWKRFTGWVAAAMTQERVAAEQRSSEPGSSRDKRASKAPLPGARRAAPTVNVDAGAWAMEVGKLPLAVERYRWALEELRATLMASEPLGTAATDSAGAGRAALEQVGVLWRAVEAESLTAPGPRARVIGP